MAMEQEYISIRGAKVNNLKSVDLDIPRDKLVVITGLSGSGKSSLAFDTIYAEGQRRYMETLSAYARQFIGTMERPQVDTITGLSPVVAIEQKTTNKNPRSTVGTVTEINDFLRLLYARASRAYSPNTGEEMVHYSDNQIVELIKSDFADHKIALLAPVVQGRKGHYRELFDGFLRKGYLYVRVDGEILEISQGMYLDRYKVHHIDLVIDRLAINSTSSERLSKSLQVAMNQGKGTIAIYDYTTSENRYYSRHLMCPTTGIAFADPAPYTFSFNSPQGACPRCGGLGEVTVFDEKRLFQDRQKSIKNGGITPLGKVTDGVIFAMLTVLGRRYDFTLDDPISALSVEAVSAIIDGDSEPLKINVSEFASYGGTRIMEWIGLAEYISRHSEDDGVGSKWSGQFTVHQRCPVCNGDRLNSEALQFRVADLNIAQVSDMSIEAFAEWVKKAPKMMSERELVIAREILKEISERTHFLLDVGLGYLTLSRSSRSLSGGESQRIRLATQVGSKLVNVLYILDEPSIGLHQRDNRKLIESLKNLRDVGNSVIVVEHDEEMMRSADHIIDIGPGAGIRGGYVIASGDFDAILHSRTLTGDYLSGRQRIVVPDHRRTGNLLYISIVGARGNNLKNIDVDIPLGKFVCITGVSGSGKSSLINGILRPAISRELYRSLDRPLDYDRIEGIENIDKLVVVDQAPLGRTPRSNPATYTEVFADIRRLFEMTPDALTRGFKAGRFSFNVRGGRCEECCGAGVKTIEMNFLPDVYITCPSCNGKRYNAETLEVKYKGKNIFEVLDMTIDGAAVFFENIPKIYAKLHAVQEVGLGYLKLGQPVTTLSGGESQRIKLASELAKRDTGRTLYILDEPTTGLHFEDVNQLLQVLQKLTDRGNTMLVIEHNLDVIRCADWIIDMGPEGGDGGGEIVAIGTPEQVSENPRSYTGHYLR